MWRACASVTQNQVTCFAKFLSSKLDVRTLGYFERVSESAAQYAQRLLEGKALPDGRDANRMAEHLVYAYKDHSFVIDKDEAKGLLGEHIKSGTPEYNLGNKIHNFLYAVDALTRVLKESDTSVIGDHEGLHFTTREEDE